MIRVITDSTFGIPRKFREENNIKVVNLKLILDGEIVDEGEEATWEPFFDKLRVTKSFPTTSQPSPQDFSEAIEEIYSEDKNAEIFILTIASALSGTINAARIAAGEFEGKKIEVIDTTQATGGSFIILEEIVNLIKAGKTFDEISSLVPKIIESTDLYFVAPTLEYMRRGGRCNRIVATFSNVLQIKPIIRFKENVVSISKMAFGVTRALMDMVALIPKNIKQLYLMHVSDSPMLEKLKGFIKEKLNIEPELYSCSPVFGCHNGPGSVGVSYLLEY